MTDSVTISPGHDNVPIESSRTFQYSGHVPGWVVPDTMELLTDIDSGLAAGPLNQFDESSSASSMTVTIDTGEAIVGGAGLARDTTTDVTLASNTADQTVYVGWSYNSLDTVKIGLSGDFVAEDPRIPIWTYDTDGSGVTSTTEERRLGEKIDVQNERYEGGGVEVDAAATASNATNLGNAPPSAYLRSNENDSTSAALGSTVGGAFDQTLGTSEGEFSRVGGTNSDLVYQVEGGSGRISIAWNAYYDNVDDVWRSIVASEGHAMISFLPFDPTSSLDGFMMAAAPSNANADDQIAWEYIRFDSSGDLQMNQGELVDAVIENRSSRPSNPNIGQIIYRTDKD